MIISAFPGTGKSYFVNNNQAAFDSDSSHFSWVVDESGNKTRNPQFPMNYVEHIRDLDSQGKLVFVSSHKEVREALWEAHIPAVVVVPWIDNASKEEYVRRFKARGSSDAFINLISQNWKEWIWDAINPDSTTPFPVMVMGSEETITTTERNWKEIYRDKLPTLAKKWGVAP